MLTINELVDIVLVKFHISIEIGDLFPIVKLKSRGDTFVVDTALEIIETELLYSLGNCIVTYWMALMMLF